MLSSIKITLTNAPRKIYNKAAETVSSAKSKIGEFHNRAVAPKVTAAKEQLTSLKSQLSSKYSQLWPRFSKNESKTEDSKSTVGNRNAEVPPQVEEQAPPTQPKNWNCTVGGVETDVEDLRSQFENKTLSTQELYDKLTGLASRARDANQLGSVLNLMDDVLKSDASGTGLQHLNTLAQLQTAIKDSPLKAHAFTLNQVKRYFTSQTKGFSVLDPVIQDALEKGLDQKKTDSKNESKTGDVQDTVGDRNAEVPPQVEEQAPPTQPKNWNCTVGGVETDVEDLRSQLENKTLSTQELYEKLTGLASRVIEVNQLVSVLNLMDDVLKSDASGTDLQHLKTLEQLQTAIKNSPLKGDSTTLNHVKAYFRTQPKGFSVLNPMVQDALANGLAQKGTNPPT